jgi:hypothetical protein
MNILLSSAVAVGVVALFLLSTILLVKREHCGDHKWRVVVGSAIEGVIVGLIAAFVMMPRLVTLTPSFHTTDIGSLMTVPMQAVLLPSAILMEVTRNGGLSNVPGLSFFLRPRRRALLIRRKIALDKQLAKLNAVVPPPHGAEQVPGA